MTVQENFRKLIIQYLTFLDIKFRENQSGVSIESSKSVIYCPLDEFYGCFFSEGYCIYVVKEVFNGLNKYRNCKLFRNTQFIHFSGLFNIDFTYDNTEKGLYEKENLPNDCDLKNCFGADIIEGIFKRLKHKNEKFNLICPDNKNMIIKQNLLKIGFIIDETDQTCIKLLHFLNIKS